MGSDEVYVVAGVSGRTGSATASTLLEAGHQVRVIVREASKGEIWAARGADVVIADLTDISALSRALEGAKGAYMVSPQQYTRDDLFTFADRIANSIAEAACNAQLPKLVALSSVGAEQNSGIGWIAMNRSLEQCFKQTDLAVTFLRAAYFIENWKPLAQIATTTGELPSFLSPLDRKIPMVATADVGRIAATALVENWCGKRVIELAGPAMYSPSDVANCLSQMANKSISVHSIPESEWVTALSGQGFSAEALSGFVEMTQGLNSGHIAFSNQAGIDYRQGDISLAEVVSSMLSSS